MFIKEREYLDKLETAIDKLDSLDYNKLSDIKSVVDDAKDDLTSIKDELKELAARQAIGKRRQLFR